jgi:hypothetical protein
LGVHPKIETVNKQMLITVHMNSPLVSILTQMGAAENLTSISLTDFLVLSFILPLGIAVGPFVFSG